MPNENPKTELQLLLNDEKCTLEDIEQFHELLDGSINDLIDIRRRIEIERNKSPLRII
ncbi:hypothetical protein MuYL_3490 [Mucilaginibacter xinganensis]|uniref:Uncharacterized protein n=2 Tax=Mucilaginibacter xinganensis TaxID=1234841 RepID=A0A223NZU1_9SPHI|nr:hypothetical protein MuYL_3490 [Mucilaginibacter xinganensis]